MRPGLSSRRIVVMAHRDARGSPALAELSGTAALLELARVFKVRDLSSTLVLVSTSGGSGGNAGAHAFAESAEGDPIDAAIVLGDLAGKRIHKPWIVPWSNDRDAAPMGLRRTLESAVRREVGAQAGGSRAIGQWARRALPLTVSEQGEAARGGLPAVLLQVSGETGPSPRAAVSENRLDAFGRAAMRAVIALDARVARADDDGLFAHEAGGIITVRRLLPDWAIRLLVGTLLLPPLLTAIDAFFGARRRRLPVLRWIGWVAAGTVPFLLAWLWIRLLGLTGAIDATRGPVLPEALPLEGWRIAALVSAPLVLVLAWLGPRRVLVSGLHLPATVSAGGAAAALSLVISVLAVGRLGLQPARRGAARAGRPRVAVRDLAGHVDVGPRARLPRPDRARAAGADGGPLRGRARPRPARPGLARVPDHRRRAHLAARRARALAARRLPVRGRRRRAHAPACGQAGRARADPHPRPAGLRRAGLAGRN